MPKPLTSRYFCPAPTQAAAEQSGDRQRREKGPLILTAEKGEHRSAHERWYSLANDNARDVASPADKMGNQGLFPVVAVPPAFFGTFFRFERKYYPPRGDSPTVRAGVGASIPRRGFSDGRLISDRHKQGGFPFAPCTPSGHSRSNKLLPTENDICSHTKRLSAEQTIPARTTTVRFTFCSP